MTDYITIGNRRIGKNNPTFVIAEAGINHNGDIDMACQLAKAAGETGVDAVKYQTFQGADMMIESAASAAHLDAGVGLEDVYTFAHRIALDLDAHKRIIAECEGSNLMFLSSVFSEHSVDLLESLGVQAYKIASMDLNNLPLLGYAAAMKKPMIVSTGMGTLAEIECALATIYNNGGSEVVLLHCTSQYPTMPEDVNLAAIDTLAHAFKVPVGYSDHTEGNMVSLAAVARGACMIEKHFTLDRKLPGPDQSLSGEPSDFRDLVAGIRIIESALGTGSKIPTKGELEIQSAFRRSIVSATEIKTGTVISAEMLAFKRPGTGISPVDIGWVVGRTAKSDIAADSIVQADQLA